MKPCQFPKCDREALPFRNRCALHVGEPLSMEPVQRVPEWIRRAKANELPPKEMAA